MYNVSQRFLEALKGPHDVAFKLEVIGPNKQVLPDTFQIVGGNVTDDRSRSIRRECTLEIPFDTFVWNNELLHPLSGNEFRPYRGIRYTDGTEELVPLGVFRTETINIKETAKATNIKIVAYDRSKEVSIAGLANAVSIDRGINYAVAIKDFIEFIRPGRFTFLFDEIVAVTPELVFFADGRNDPWERAQEMAESVAHNLSFDRVGICDLSLYPLVGRDSPVITYQGSDLYIGGETEITSRGVHNHIVVYGEPPNADDPPVRGEAMDTDPTNQTYVGDPVGTGNFYSSHIMSSEYITSEAQAIAVAEARLRQTLSKKRKASITSAVNPALSSADIIRLNRPAMGSAADYIIESLNVPLSIGGTQDLEVTQ